MALIRSVELSADVSYGSLATKRPADVCLTPSADITERRLNVRVVPEADSCIAAKRCFIQLTRWRCRATGVGRLD